MRKKAILRCAIMAGLLPFVMSGTVMSTDHGSDVDLADEEMIIGQMDVQDAYLGHVIEQIYEGTGLNFLIDDEVRSKKIGRLFMTGKTLRVVLNSMSEMTGSHWWRDKNGIFHISVNPQLKKSHAGKQTKLPLLGSALQKPALV